MNQVFTLGRSCAKFPVARMSPRDSLSMNSWYVISAASDDDGDSDEKLNAAAGNAAVTGEFEWIAFQFAACLGCPGKKAALSLHAVLNFAFACSNYKRKVVGKVFLLSRKRSPKLGNCCRCS